MREIQYVELKKKEEEVEERVKRGVKEEVQVDKGKVKEWVKREAEEEVQVEKACWVVAKEEDG